MNTNPNHFNQYGYVVMKGLIPLSKIDECVTSLEEFKKSKYQIYFSQSRHVWTRANHITKTGFLAESIQHPSKLIFSRRIQEAVIEVITDHEISTALKSITGYEDFIRWQDMLFDKSTGTVDHADNWYLDTFPSGNMVGSWIALEDIHEDAGRFFVVPESNHLSLPTYSEAISHEDYLKVVHNEITSKGLSRYAPELRKGDVLFWHSKTIHGSLSQKNEMYSRKSITAHYHPIGMARDKARSPEEILKYLTKMLPSKNPRIYLDNFDPNTFHFLLHGYARYLKRLLFRQPQEQLIMSRNEDS